MSFQRSAQSCPARQWLPYQGSWRGACDETERLYEGQPDREPLRDKTSPSSLRDATARVAAPSVCFAVACILLAAAPTAPPCFRRWRRSSPLPQRGSHWRAGPLPTGRRRPDMAQKRGPRLRGQRLLDNAPCQATVNLGSSALLFPRYCALLVQHRPDRHAKGSPSGRAGA